MKKSSIRKEYIVEIYMYNSYGWTSLGKYVTLKEAKDRVKKNTLVHPLRIIEQVTKRKIIQEINALNNVRVIDDMFIISNDSEV